MGLISSFGFWLVAGLVIMYFIWEVWKLGSKLKKPSSGEENKKERDPFK